MTHQAHSIVKQLVHVGDIVVDATVGNGYDTVFLRNLVGESGKVVGFDIQSAALHATRLRLDQQLGECNNVQLLHVCHTKMNEHLPAKYREKVAGVMFNLGYLPGADHDVCTRALTTSTAIEQALPLLKIGGVLTVIVYTGHEAGPQELAAVEALTNSPVSRDFRWCKHVSAASPATAPVLFVAERQAQT